MAAQVAPNREREHWLRRCLAKVWSRCLRCGGMQEVRDEQLTGFGVWAVCVECQYPERLLWWRTHWMEEH